MAKAYVGALVRYCGHLGTFVADIYEVGNANVIHPSTPVTMENLNRDPVDYEHATHHMVDHPVGGFWRPRIGVFVVPAKQVTIL